ncbi:MAG: methyl-accepting chemotaxis protein, partial [Hydrogenophilus sp.]|nr:methyl-accepting chemotaxis protein [Hydrogenophilus sp.]
MRLQDWRIAVKLGLGFGLMIVGLVAIAAFGLLQVQAVGGIVDRLVNDRFPKTVWANTIIDNVNVVIRSVRLYLLTTPEETAERERIKNNIAEARKRVVENLQRLEEKITSVEGKRLLSELKSARERYLNEERRLWAAIDGGRSEEARKLAFTDYRTASNEYIKKVEDLIAYQTKLAEEDGEAAEKAVAETTVWLSGLGIALLLFGIVVAILIARSVSRPLAQAVSVAEAVAGGDLTVRVEAERRDEVGQLLAALATMVARLKETVVQVKSNADGLAHAAEQVSATAQSLAQSSSEQAAAV